MYIVELGENAAWFKTFKILVSLKKTLWEKEKSRKMLDEIPTFSPYPKMFSNALFSRVGKTRICLLNCLEDFNMFRNSFYNT